MDEAYPQVLTHLDGNASFSVKTDIAATIFYLVQKSSEDAPTAETLKTATTKKDVTANAETVIEVEELEDKAEYIAYFLPVSLRGVQAENISQTDAFTMDVTPPVYDKPTAEIYINKSDTEEIVESGTSVTLKARVSVDERTAPYTLTWMDQQHNVLLTETYDSADEIDDNFKVTATPTKSTDYIFTVTDHVGNSCTATVRAIVRGGFQVADFEDLYLPEEGYENGSGLQLNSFVSGSFKFDNFYSTDYYGGYWGNYAYANQTGNSFVDLSDQYKNVVGGGAAGTSTYLVGYPDYYNGKIYVTNQEEGVVIPGMYITNDVYTVDAILHGDGLSNNGLDTGFGQGDYLVLTITADNENSTDVYLADYRSSDSSEWYYINKWEWIDLSALGTVKSLSFSLDGTKRGQYGLNTPAYFCLDEIGAENPNANSITTRINQIPDSENAQGIYSIDGKVLTRGSKQKGVQIVRMKDGSVRKVVR
jgi:hypothetical protein